MGRKGMRHWDPERKEGKHVLAGHLGVKFRPSDQPQRNHEVPKRQGVEEKLSFMSWMQKGEFSGNRKSWYNRWFKEIEMPASSRLSTRSWTEACIDLHTQATSGWDSNQVIDHYFQKMCFSFYFGFFWRLGDELLFKARLTKKNNTDMSPRGLQEMLRWLWEGRH